MKIGLLPAGYTEDGLLNNAALLKRYLQRYAGSGIDFLCFGETFLQGGNCLSFHYSKDLPAGISGAGEIFTALLQAAKEYRVGAAFGYIERMAERLYSSYAYLTPDGKLYHNSRRTTPGWHTGEADPDYYREGERFTQFRYQGKKIGTAHLDDIRSPQNIPKLKALDVDILICPNHTDPENRPWDEILYHEVLGLSSKLTCDFLLVNTSANRRSTALHLRQGRLVSELHPQDAGLLLTITF